MNSSPRQPRFWLSSASLLVAIGLASSCSSGTCPFSGKKADAAPEGGKCPMGYDAPAAPMTAGAPGNRDWWPAQLELSVLHQNSVKGNPLGAKFEYAKEFQSLDLQALRTDIVKVLRTSQPWWPSDYGHYGPFMVRMAWHSAGTYRSTDGRGGACDGTQRFAPLNSWPDNANLDKARRLLWPIKMKYGQQISWADLMIFTGNVALEDMGFKTFGFAGGRDDVWEPQNDIFWGTENQWLAGKRHGADGKLDNPLAAVQMGLIYVNPEGPGGKPDPLAAAAHIRETFGRMAMNDEETVALIAGGHSFGKAHGAASPKGVVGPEPEGAALEEQGFGWTSSHGKGHSEDTITSGLEGAWTSTPARFSHMYFANLFAFEWELTTSPAGAQQWRPKNGGGANSIPDAHVAGKFHAPMMFTTDLALRLDPAYEKISRRFLDNPKAFEDAFARAWFKLTHRDMGPSSRYLGALSPKETLIWQDPIPAVNFALIDANDVTALKQQILASGLSVSELVSAAWASASTFRGSDNRGGANGARVRLAPQKDWPVNKPAELAKVLKTLDGIQAGFNAQAAGGKKVSMADLIVLAGNAAVEKAAADAGTPISIAFRSGRVDASEAQTDAASFAVLEPKVDGFRNFVGKAERPETQLVDRAQLLGLSAPEMTVLIGGLRVLGANSGDAKLGSFTKRPGQLSNDWFVNLLDMGTSWKKTAPSLYEGRDRSSGALKWTASSVDLAFGSNSQLRALCEVYASEDGKAKFLADFNAAWTKVMEKDRFDLHR